MNNFKTKKDKYLKKNRLFFFKMSLIINGFFKTKKINI